MIYIIYIWFILYKVILQDAILGSMMVLEILESLLYLLWLFAYAVDL